MVYSREAITFPRAAFSDLVNMLRSPAFCFRIRREPEKEQQIGVSTYRLIVAADFFTYSTKLGISTRQVHMLQL
jgi:hypothetical protein